MRRLIAAAVLAFATSAAAGEITPAVTPPGLVGEYYAPASVAFPPRVLVLGGSEGGLGGSAPLARKLAAEGYGALALAYFGADGVPRTLQSVPLEYFAKALDWLGAQPGERSRRMAIYGGSKGGEAALLVAAGDPRVCAVVAGVPANVAWAGINPANLRDDPGPSWTRAGQPVPYAPYDRSAPFKGVLDLYTRSWAKAPPEAQIPVEQIRGPVLLVSGRQDQLWPSTAMAEAAMARLDKAKFKYAHSHLAYDDAGHGGFGAPLPADSPNIARLGGLGGSGPGNQAARADAWPRELAFLNAAFKTGCR
jgi:hypothetical protein